MKSITSEHQKIIVVPEEESENLEPSTSVFSYSLESLAGLKDFIATALLTPAPRDQQEMLERTEEMIAELLRWEGEILTKQNKEKLSESAQRELDARRGLVRALREQVAHMATGMDLLRRVASSHR